MPNLMMTKCLISSRIRDSEGTVARPDTVTGQHKVVKGMLQEWIRQRLKPVGEQYLILQSAPYGPSF
jgi:hypothetical protein